MMMKGTREVGGRGETGLLDNISQWFWNGSLLEYVVVGTTINGN